MSSIIHPFPGPRIYLAGPQVFLPDAKAQGEHLRALCAAAGLCGVFPLDAEVPEGADMAERIRLACLEQLRSCTGIIADFTPFRGVSADVGTAYEMGYAAALGLPAEAWSSDPSDYADRVPHSPHPLLGAVAADGSQVETFGLGDNLMLGCAVERFHASFEAAATEMALRLGLPANIRKPA